MYVGGNKSCLCAATEYENKRLFLKESKIGSKWKSCPHKLFSNIQHFPIECVLHTRKMVTKRMDPDSWREVIAHTKQCLVDQPISVLGARSDIRVAISIFTSVLFNKIWMCILRPFGSLNSHAVLFLHCRKHWTSRELVFSFYSFC